MRQKIAKKYFRFCANCENKFAETRAKLIAFHVKELRKSSQKKISRKLRKFCGTNTVISWKPYYGVLVVKFDTDVRS